VANVKGELNVRASNKGAPVRYLHAAKHGWKPGAAYAVLLMSGFSVEHIRNLLRHHLPRFVEHNFIISEAQR
jgi:hypothetical protein